MSRGNANEMNQLWNVVVCVVFVVFVVFAAKETETRHTYNSEEQSVDRPIEPAYYIIQKIPSKDCIVTQITNKCTIGQTDRIAE